MNLRDLASSLWRRKILVVLLLLLVPGACYGLSTVVSPTYESKASVLLIPPKGGVAEVVNPYLSLNGLSPAVEVLAGSLSDQETALAVEEMAPGATYEAFADPQGSAPVLFITVDTTNEVQSIDTLAMLVQRAQDELERVQAAAAIEPASVIGSVVVSRDAKPEVIQKKRIRVVAAAGVVLLVGGLALIGLIDGLLLRRRARKDPGVSPGTSIELAGGGPPSPGTPEVNGVPAPLAISSSKEPVSEPAPEPAPERAQEPAPERAQEPARENGTPSKNPALKSGRRPKRR